MSKDKDEIKDKLTGILSDIANDVKKDKKEADEEDVNKGDQMETLKGILEQLEKLEAPSKKKETDEEDGNDVNQIADALVPKLVEKLGEKFETKKVDKSKVDETLTKALKDAGIDTEDLDISVKQKRKSSVSDDDEDEVIFKNKSGVKDEDAEDEDDDDDVDVTSYQDHKTGRISRKKLNTATGVLNKDARKEALNHYFKGLLGIQE